MSPLLLPFSPQNRCSGARPAVLGEPGWGSPPGTPFSLPGAGGGWGGDGGLTGPAGAAGARRCTDAEGEGWGGDAKGA